MKGGKVRVLASWSTERLKLLPEVPTFRELGYKDVEFYIWAGMVVPAATPAPAQQKLREAVRAAVNDPQFSGAMEKVGSPIDYRDAPEFKKYWDADAARLKTALQKIGKVEDTKK
jgi:tripartite-type tricarboxylate transporter receptor subunit TctC